MLTPSFFKPLKVGSLTLRSNILYAPLAGCSDWPFRSMCYPYGPGLTFCEMVKMDALVRHDPHTYRLLDFDRTMNPIGAQLCGSKPDLAKDAARIIEDLGFSLLDLNCGCPVDKVTKDASGSGMLRSLSLIEKVLTALVQAVSIPVTIKIRAGWDENSIVGPAITKMAEAIGAKMITVHGRTREQAYKGPANWDYIKQCKDEAKSILVLGNGDVFCPDSALALFKKTGVDGVLVARGTLGAPWIAEDIERKLLALPKLERSTFFYQGQLKKHIDTILQYQNPRRALTDIRRISSWYLKSAKGTRALRDKINKSQTIAEILFAIEEFSWESVDFSILEEVLVEK